MAWRCSGATNTALIENLVAANLIKNPLVRDAMLAVDRAHYSPSMPYDDAPQPIGHAATISAPHMHAYAAESLAATLFSATATRNHPPRVLDVGSGSGYLSHVLAELVRDQAGTVVGVDHIPQLVDLAQRNAAKSNAGRELMRSGALRFVLGDGRRGWVGEGEGEEGEGQPGFDAIHVGAASKGWHAELIEQLRRNGRLFVPVEEEGGEQNVWVVDKDGEGRVSRRKVMGVRYVPLTDAPRIG